MRDWALQMRGQGDRAPVLLHQPSMVLGCVHYHGATIGMVERICGSHKRGPTGPPCAKPEVRRHHHGRYRCREVQPLPVHHVRHEGVLGSNPRLAPASPFGDDGSTTSRRSGRSGGACGKQDVANRLTAVYRGPPESDYGAEALLAMAAKPLRIIIGISILHHATSRYPYHFGLTSNFEVRFRRGSRNGIKVLGKYFGRRKLRFMKELSRPTLFEATG